jgi:POT family proton-dependent oligopeptide transporter
MNLAERRIPETRAPDAPRRNFFGHPWGLAFLAGTESWVSFSYYGMQSLLVLYMTGQLLKPGHLEHVLGFEPFHTALQWVYGPLSGQPLASAISGVFGALWFATPIVGGYAADRWFGRTPSIMAGCVLMTLGHFLMAFEPSFLIALACLVIGGGLAGTLKAQVGDLYAKGDLRRADAFQLYTLAVQAAVIFSPIVCGALGEKVAWHWGFGAAGVGMLIGLVIYASGLKLLPPELPRAPRCKAKARAVAPDVTRRDWQVLAIWSV